MYLVKYSEIYLYVGIFLSMLSCTTDNKTMGWPSYVTDNNPLEIKGESLLNSDDLGRPSRIWIDGDTLILLDAEGEYFYSMISKANDGKGQIKRFGKIGNGPREFIRPACLQIDIDGITYAYDSVKKRMYKYGAPDSLINIDVLNDTVEYVNFRDKTGGFLMKISNGYVGDCLYGDGNMLRSYDDDGVFIESFAPCPHKDSYESFNPDYYMTFQAQFAVSPDKKYLCIAGTYHDWLAFFDVSGQHPVLLKEYYSTAPVVKASGKDDQYHLDLLPTTIHHFWSIASYETGFYLNYIGASQKELDKGEITNHILQTDLQGNILNCLSTDKTIGAFASSLKGDEIYGISFMNSYSQPYVFKFELPESS